MLLVKVPVYGCRPLIREGLWWTNERIIAWAEEPVLAAPKDLKTRHMRVLEEEL